MKKIIFLLLFTGSSFVFAQFTKSIHQVEDDFYSKNLKFGISNFDQGKATIVKKNSGSKWLIKSVFGFLPWWEYLAGTHQSLRYDLLSHVAIFSFQTDELGELTDPPGWPWGNVLTSLFDNNVKVLITITNFDPDAIHRLMTDIGVRKKLLENIRAKIMQYGLNGVIIDFENIKDADKEFAIRIFLGELKNYLYQFNQTYEIAFATPAVTYGKWYFSNILEFVDYLFIMGYDYYGSFSSSTGPSSPLIGVDFNLTKSLNEDYFDVPSNKLILGVPYYGNYWKTNSNNPYAAVTPYDSMSAVNNWVKPALKYSEIISSYNQKEKLFDNISKTPWLRWQDTTWNQIWYDTDSSLAMKYDLAISKNLKGIGIWALGYDNGRTELWNLIEKKFWTTTDVNDESLNLPLEFQLNQNYPNPFNPSTIISWKLTAGSFVTLKVYDLLGREVETLVNEYQTAGNHRFTFNIKSSKLSSGIYFYTLRSGNFNETKKMILMQ